MLRTLAALLASTLLTLSAVEVLIRWQWIPQPPFLDSTGWWREQFIRKGPGPRPAEFPIVARVDPELGWRAAPGLDEVLLAGARVSTNSLGWRGKREVPLERTPGVRRIVAIGDSFTFGQCVDDHETFPARLEQRLPDTEVLNLGVMGYGHGQMLLRLERDGLPYRPDAVLLGFHVVDIPRNQLSFREYPKPRFRLREGKLVLGNVPVPGMEEVRRSLRWQPRVVNYALMMRDRLLAARRERAGETLTQAIVVEMATVARAAGARFALVYLPVLEDLERDEPQPVPLVAKLCEREDLLCISPIRRLREKLGPRRGRHFKCHYSPRVQALIADEIAEALVRADLLPDAPRSTGP